MDRDEIRERFSPLLDGELSPEERAEVEAVLAEDAELLRELDSLKRVDQLYSQLPPVSAPEGFEDGIRTALKPDTLQFARARVLRQRLWPLLAAAAMFIVVAAVVVFQMQPAPSRFDTAMLSEEATSPAREAELQRSAPAEDFDYSADAGDVSSRRGRAVEMKDEFSAKGTASPRQRMQQEAHRQLRVPAVSQEQEQLQEGAAGQTAAGAMPRAVPAVPEPPATAGPEEKPEELPSLAAEEVSAPTAVTAGELPGIRDKEAAAEEAMEPQVEEQLSALGYAANEPSEVLKQEAPLMAKKEPSTVAAEAETTVAPEDMPQRSFVADSVSPGDEPTVQPETPPALGAAKPAEPLKAAGRTFQVREKEWIQQGYAGEKLTTVTRDSDAWKKLVKQDEDLKELPQFKGRIVFRLKDTWYELLPEEEPRKTP